MGRGNMGRGEGGMEIWSERRDCMGEGEQVLVWGTEEFGDEGERLGFNKQYCEGFAKRRTVPEFSSRRRRKSRGPAAKTARYTVVLR